MTKNINYKSDFKLFMASPTGWDAPFRITMYTPGHKADGYVVSFDGTDYNNCHKDDQERLVVAVDNHNLGAGPLLMDVETYLSDKDYSDGICHIYNSGMHVQDSDGNIYVMVLYGETDTDISVALPPFYMEGPQGEQGPQGERGPQGEPGPSVTVINDLTTGGADKALSAEMGKMLGMSVEEETLRATGRENDLDTSKADKTEVDALSKEVADVSVRIGDISAINLDPSQFSNIIWNGTSFVKANENYNSYILRIPEETKFTPVGERTGVLYYAFKDKPYVGYAPTDYILIRNFSDYPNGLPLGYTYLLLAVNLKDGGTTELTIEFAEYGIAKNISVLSKKIDKIIPYEETATFSPGFILPKNGNLDITDNASYVHSLQDCVEGQRFVVTGRGTAYVATWQFLDASNNILTKYEEGSAEVIDAEIIAPKGAKKILVNSALNVNYSVRFWASNIPENVLQTRIEEIAKNVVSEETINDIRLGLTATEESVKSLSTTVGASQNVTVLTENNFSGLVYSGTEFVKANATYDSFVLPVVSTFSIKGIVGISSVFTFSSNPELGKMPYVRKFTSYTNITPTTEERHIVININKPNFIDNNSSYITEAYGLVKEVDAHKSALAGRNILCLGDSITEFNYQGKRYSDYLAEITGANVINGGIGGTQMGRRVTLPDSTIFTANSQAYAALDLPSIAHALNSGDFTLQEAAAQWLISESNPSKTTDDNTSIIATLKSVNLANVDIVTIFIGTNDVGANLGEIGEIGDDTSGLNMAKGFQTIIKNLLSANPNLRIYYFSPMPRYFGDIRTFDPDNAQNDNQWCDNYESLKGFKFPEMVDHQIKLAHCYKIPVCDMYRTMGINQWNIASIMRGDISDGTHPYKGFKMIANKIASFIIANNNLNI